MVYEQTERMTGGRILDYSGLRNEAKRGGEGPPVSEHVGLFVFGPQW